MKLLRSIKVYRKWLKIWGTLPVRDWIRGAAYYRVGAFDRAAVLYQRGIQRHPKHPANVCARIDWAYCLFRIGRIEKSREILEYVIARLPNSKEAHLRLGELLMWSESYLAAAMTAKQGLRAHPNDPELTALFLQAAVENDGPSQLLDEAVLALQECDFRRTSVPRLEIARASWWIYEGNAAKGKSLLLDVLEAKAPPVEGYLKLAELLMGEAKFGLARRELRKALREEPRHPKTLSLLAFSYLEPGSSFNPEFAIQLALSAAINSAWLSPAVIYTLAQSYFAEGDRMNALLVASRARQVGSELGAYRYADKLERFIETLESGTLS